MTDNFNSMQDEVVTEVELRQLENIHQAKILINRIEDNCNGVWGALEKLENIKTQAEAVAKVIHEGLSFDYEQTFSKVQ